MATTTNYGWTTPDDTALVKDGAAAIRSLGTSIDTTTKNLNPSTTLGDLEYRSSTSNTNTRIPIGTSGQGLQVVAGVPAWAASSTSTLTTTGDILYASAANTLARRAIGSTGDVLTVSGGLPVWVAPSASTVNLSLINAGGTALSTGTTTISGISGKNFLYIYVTGMSSTGTNSPQLRFNSDSANNYYGIRTDNQKNLGPGFYLKDLTAAATTGDLAVIVTGAAGTGYKAVTLNSWESNGGTTMNLTGHYAGTSAISSVNLVCSGGTWDAGTIFVYGG